MKATGVLKAALIILEFVPCFDLRFGRCIGSVISTQLDWLVKSLL